LQAILFMVLIAGRSWPVGSYLIAVLMMIMREVSWQSSSNNVVDSLLLRWRAWLVWVSLCFLF